MEQCPCPDQTASRSDIFAQLTYFHIFIKYLSLKGLKGQLEIVSVTMDTASPG